MSFKMMIKGKYLSDITQQEQTVDKERVARFFSASIATYEQCATVQNILANAVVRWIAGSGRVFRRGLEIGCGTGYLGQVLTEKIAFEKLYINDLSEELCIYAAQRLAGRCRTESIIGDIEQLALPSGLDLVVSSSTFQWLEDLDALFLKVATALEKDGLFVFSLFGKGTMAEIAALSGRGLRYRDFSTLCGLLNKYFVIEQQEKMEKKLFFPSVLAIFKHIRNTGTGGLRQARWTRAGLAAFETRYRQQYGTEKGLPVSYCAYTFMAAVRK